MESTFVLNQREFERLLDEHQMTIYQLADAMGVNPSTVYRIKNGDNQISASSMAKMVQAFGLREAGINKLFLIAPVLHVGNGKA